MAKQKTIEQQYRKLSEVEHCLNRPGRYIGSTKPHTAEEHVPVLAAFPGEVRFTKRQVTYNPGFLKLFDELISNSVDHSKRPEGQHLDTIRVTVDQAKGEISVYDNGGIPVVMHQEYQQWVPELIFELRAGSNFDDTEEATLTGQNGEGAALTNIFSTRFMVETCDGQHKFKQVFEHNSQQRGRPKVTPAEGAKGFTCITYRPDLQRLGLEQLDDDNVSMLLARVFEVAATNPRLKVYFNGARVPVRSFKDYIELVVGPAGEYVYDESEAWRVGVALSDDGFQHLSFVNATRTKLGGTHVTYVAAQLCERLREHLKRRHKVDVKPAELRQHLLLFIDAAIVNPRYSSQTKDELITEVKDFKTSWTVPDKMINKIVKSAIIQNILNWVAAKQYQEELRELRKLNKETDKTDPRRIEKFSDALEKKERHKCVIFLTEGDCLHENTSVLKYEDGSLTSYPIKDVNVGDFVLTHENRLREVLSKSQKVSIGVKINTSKGTIIASPTHRLIAYHAPTRQFIEVMAKDLTKDHKLIKNRLVDASFFSPIVSVVPIKHDSFDLEITFEAELDNPILSTLSHRFLVWDALKAEFVFERADQLEAGRHSMVIQ
jgi:DNA topoisomerase-2